MVAALEVEADSLEDGPFGDPLAIQDAEPLEVLPWAEDTTETELEALTVSRYYYDDDGTYYYEEADPGYEDSYEYSSYAADYYRYDDPYFYASPYVYYEPYTSYSPYYRYGWCRARYTGYYGYYGRYRCYDAPYA